MSPDQYKVLAQRLHEYHRNPHHIDPMSNGFHRLCQECIEALRIAAKRSEEKWSEK